jgi:hypothetical protein
MREREHKMNYRNSDGTWKYALGMEPHRCPGESEKQFQERVARQEAQYEMLLSDRYEWINGVWQNAADAAAAK